MEFRNITKIARNLGLYKNKFNKEKLNDNEYELVRYLSKHQEGLAQNEIAYYLNVDKALVTRMVKKLENEEYLTIFSDLSDLRKKIVKPTDKSLKLKKDTENEEIKYYDLVTNVLSLEEKEEFNNLLEKVYLESKRLRKLKFKE